LNGVSGLSAACSKCFHARIAPLRSLNGLVEGFVEQFMETTKSFDLLLYFLKECKKFEAICEQKAS
jgi:hypothetical protein